MDLNRLDSILGILQYFPVYVPPAPWCASAGAIRNPYKVAFPAKSGCEWQTGASKSLFVLCTLVFTDGRAKMDKPESGKSRKYSQLRQRAIIYFILEHGSKTCARRMGSVGRNKHSRVHYSTAGKEREKN